MNKYFEETYVLAEYLPNNGDVCYSTEAEKRTTIYDVEEDVKLMESALETTEEIETNFSELHTLEEIDYVQELALKYLREETSYKVIAIDLADDTSEDYKLYKDIVAKENVLLIHLRNRLTKMWDMIF